MHPSKVGVPQRDRESGTEQGHKEEEEMKDKEESLQCIFAAVSSPLLQEAQILNPCNICNIIKGIGSLTTQKLCDDEHYWTWVKF